MITKNTTRRELVAIVVRKLQEHGIRAVLVGGSVVSLYTDNKYETKDLDFVSMVAPQRLTEALAELGFYQEGRSYAHKKTKFTVEFPTGPLAIGNDAPVEPEAILEIDGVKVTTWSPTQAVMDRLLIYFLENDPQCLDQAIWITEAAEVDVDRIVNWAQREGHSIRMQRFLRRLKRSKQSLST